MIPQPIKKILSPVLQVLVRTYLAKTRNYRYSDIRLKIHPGVFHPGFFFSTKVLLEYLSRQELKGKKLLELGAGCGLISIYCSKKGAVVTASDISGIAIRNLEENVKNSSVPVRIVESDLFDSLSPLEFDWIVVNPPFYPRTPSSESERAWYCGSEFEYFTKLFTQLRDRPIQAKVIMVLSEDCDVKRITSIANSFSHHSSLVGEAANFWERNQIFEWMRSPV